MWAITGTQGARRALLVLGVLAGLFAMHGLTADHDLSMPPGMAMAGHHTSHLAGRAEPVTMSSSSMVAPPSQQVVGVAEVMGLPTAASLGFVGHAAQTLVMAGIDHHSGDGGSGDHVGAGACLGVLILVLLAAVLLAATRATARIRWVLRRTVSTCGPAHRRRWRHRIFCLSLTELSLSRT